MSQFIFGPVLNGTGLLMSSILGKYYVLTTDPNPSFGLYFALSTGNASFVTVTTKISETNGVSFTVGGKGLFYDSNLQTVILSNAVKGNVNYLYKGGASAPLLTGTVVSLVNIDQGQIILRFGYKTPEQALQDANSYQQNPTSYRPKYSGFTQDVIYIPSEGIQGTNCNILETNGPYLAYSGKPSGSPVYYTLQTWCQNKTQPPICSTTEVCGSCYGNCPSNRVCSPVENGTNLSCQDPLAKKPWYETGWFIALMVFVGIAILAVIVFLIISNV